MYCIYSLVHRNPLKKLLNQYQIQFPDHAVVEEFYNFVSTHLDCFDRSLQAGHVTASAWIIDPHRHTVLLVHHKKLGLWLQPGGHCDGESDVAIAARKEVTEETGLDTFTLFEKEIFDLDIHQIPKWKEVPAHLHYDVRFLIHADSQLPITVSNESNALKWFELEKVQQITTDQSVFRMAQKI